MALTELTIKNLKPRDAKYKKADGGGLVLFIMPNGDKLWRYRYRFQKLPNTLSFGKYPAVSLAEARNLLHAHVGERPPTHQSRVHTNQRSAHPS